MAMTYTSLTAAKGTSGSIANWVNYTKLDIAVILDEAQALIFQYLRVREMKTHSRFTMAVNASSQALPSDFLDPIGEMYCQSINRSFKHKDDGFIQANRNYQETSGTFGSNPFTTTNGSGSVSVALTGSGATQDSSVYIAGATAVNGLTIAGTFDITSITDANNFVIDCSSLGTANATGSGGGASATYLLDTLTPGIPSYWSIWDEKIRWDQSFNQQLTCELLYYKQPALLSSSNATNFLTTRYPNLLRIACQASAADFMKDDTEFNKGIARLQAAIDRIQVQDDLIWRGATIETETP